VAAAGESAIVPGAVHRTTGVRKKREKQAIQGSDALKINTGG